MAKTEISSTTEILKGVSPVNGGRRAASLRPRNLKGFTDFAHAIWWVADTFPLAVKFDIMGVASANVQCRFVCPSTSCSQKRENTGFELVPRSTWGCSSPSNHVCRSNIPCWKRSQVCGSESEQWPKYMQQRHPQCWKWEEF